MSVKSEVMKSSGRALANGLSLAGIKFTDEYFISGKKVDIKELGIDSLVMVGTTLSSDFANSLVNKFVTLPTWLLSIESTYGLDLINLMVYVIAIMLIDMQMGMKRSFVKIVLEAVSALIMGSYIVQPLNNLLPESLKKHDPATSKHYSKEHSSKA